MVNAFNQTFDTTSSLARIEPFPAEIPNQEAWDQIDANKLDANN